MFKTLYLFRVKIFALSFGMGVVSGVVLSYQFGTNWSEFIRLTGGVIGPWLAYEVLTAFFLEASFLGVMLFGWKKVGHWSGEVTHKYQPSKTAALEGYWETRADQPPSFIPFFGFRIMVGLGLLMIGLGAGYALLGRTWLMMKTKDDLHGDAKRWTGWSAVATAVLLAAVSVATLLIHPTVAARWGFDLGDGFALELATLLPLLPIPLLGLGGLSLVWIMSQRGSHRWPFVGALLVFLSGNLGLAVGFMPYMVPNALDFRQAAAPDNALGLMLGGTAVILPMILAYTACAWRASRWWPPSPIRCRACRSWAEARWSPPCPAF